MNKNELLALFNDSDVRKKIIEVVRFGAKLPTANFTGQPSLKADLISLLNDEEVRKEIFKILRSPEKITVPNVQQPKPVGGR